MAVTKKDSAEMKRLAQEGKQISKIQKEDFKEYSYWDIYIEVYGSGERSSVGIKRMITGRLNKLINSPKSERRLIVKEIDELVWHLYENHKINQKKIDT
ncbi:MAG: hypothetical protein H8D23_06815, partial [Candidatus Brocadiales bacterium]|nr:hypothetical protein [Candidatus Brocadiales bacterium]